MRLLFLLSLLIISTTAAGQTVAVTGKLVDTAGGPVSYATVSLLDPADSTLRFFDISDESGAFRIMQVVPDSFLLQIGAMEFATSYRPLMVAGSTNLGQITMETRSQLLGEVVVKSERVPLLLKGDTVEYNAGAFRNRPDAVAEDLLRQLPGVEVDREGNIKAQGQEVDKVLVDGKEFFGNDPKVATKNLPADAVDKVQVFDRKSDGAQFTGIDDGARNKTINLSLKEDKRKGSFGTLQAAGGTDTRYQTSAKYYRFRKNKQVAVLGMANNINEFGFSMDDYLNFQGGLMSGGNFQLRINSDDDLPVNFGQQVKGLIHSGAAGFNYTYQPSASRRLNFSYLGNGFDKELNEEVNSRNFTPGSSFSRLERGNGRTTSFSHRTSLSARYDLDSSTMLSISGNGQLQQQTVDSRQLSESFRESSLVNSLESWQRGNGATAKMNGQFSFSRKLGGKVPLIRLDGESSYTRSLSNTDWTNLVILPGAAPAQSLLFTDDKAASIVAGANATVVFGLGKGYFLESSWGGGYDLDKLQRKQGMADPEEAPVDSLSPEFTRTGKYFRPGLLLQQNKAKRSLRIGLEAEAGVLHAHLAGEQVAARNYFYLLPSLMWRKELGARRNAFSVRYNASAGLPAAKQMLPVSNISNPLQVFTGNEGLRPEYRHLAGAHYIRFDEFTMSSLFLSVSGRYTADKINWSRTINPDLTQQNSMVNVPDDWVLGGNGEYSTPVRKLKINITGAVGEQYQKGINIVNGQHNRVDVFTHTASLKISNRNRSKWELQAGASLNYTTAAYSIQKELNNSYHTTTYFGEIGWRPSDRWYFRATADVSHYRSSEFDGNISVPLLKAEASWYFLKGNKGSLTLNAFDLLDRNKGIERLSELNYLVESKSNIIGQYFMLGFRYRLNVGGEEKADVIRIGG